MSARAYKLDTMVYQGRKWTSPSETVSFNSSHNPRLLTAISDAGSDMRNDSGNGHIEIHVDAMKGIIERLPELLEIPTDIIDVRPILEKDVADTIAGGDDYIIYDIY